MKILIIPIFVLLIIFPFTDINGQITNKQDTIRRVDHSVGVVIGFTTGYGLSYRFNSKIIGFQINFAPYYDEYKNIYNVGFTLLKDLLVNEKTKLFLYLSNSYNYENFHSVAYPSRGKRKYFNHGIGIGFEFLIHKRIGFNLMSGYGAYRNFEQVNLTAETGIFYKF